MAGHAQEKGILERYGRVLERIETACARSGRRRDEVTLVAVSKTFSAGHVALLYGAGQRHFGESKVQELLSKRSEIERLGKHSDLSWHMIGHLQRNKVRDVIGVASLVHSLDSVRLAGELDRRAESEGAVAECLVQVNISDEDSKFGLRPGNVASFLDEISVCRHVAVRGFMTMPAPVDDPESVRSDFSRLREMLESCNRSRAADKQLTELSMGMTQDFEVAIEEGATLVRIGSAIFGSRGY